MWIRAATQPVEALSAVATIPPAGSNSQLCGSSPLASLASTRPRDSQASWLRPPGSPFGRDSHQSLNSVTDVWWLIRVDLAGSNFERSLPDATHGNCHLLLALGPTIERLTAFAEVIERCGDRIVLGYRPVKAVCLHPVVLSINRTIATQHGIEA